MSTHPSSRARYLRRVLLLSLVAVIVILMGIALHFRAAAKATQAQLTAAEEETETVRASLEAENGDLSQALTDAQAQSSQSSFEADPPDYEALYPDFYAPEPLTANEKADMTAYLTFDDGPSTNTQAILNILDEKGVKATFFVVGRTSQADLQSMRDIVARGHTLGMHTYTHDYKKVYASVESYLDDVYQVFNLIRDTTGVTPGIFRMPGGSINAYDYGVYREILSEMLRRGFVPYDWNISSGDASGGTVSVDAILGNIMDHAAGKSRCIVLMHDTAEKGTTVEALPSVIDGLRSYGFDLEPLTAKVKPVLFGYTN